MGGFEFEPGLILDVLERPGHGVTRYARQVVTQADLELRDGRTLHAYDALVDGGDARLTVVWHHGTPNLGPPPEPLFPAAGHISVLHAAEAALDWLGEQAGQR